MSLSFAFASTAKELLSLAPTEHHEQQIQAKRKELDAMMPAVFAFTDTDILVMPWLTLEGLYQQYMTYVVPLRVNAQRQQDMARQAAEQEDCIECAEKALKGAQERYDALKAKEAAAKAAEPKPSTGSPLRETDIGYKGNTNTPGAPVYQVAKKPKAKKTTPKK